MNDRRNDTTGSTQPDEEFDLDRLDEGKPRVHPIVGFLLLTVVAIVYVEFWVWLFGAS